MRRLILTLRLYRDKHLAFNLARAWRTAGRLA
jgi:hypothetical protein